MQSWAKRILWGQYHHSRYSKMGDGNNETTSIISLLPVSALSADCKYRELCLKIETERDEVFDQQEVRSGETFNQQEERSGESFDHQTEDPEALTGNTTETNPNSISIMDTDTYNRKHLQIKLEVDKVDRKYEAYTKDQVNEIDHTRCHVKLDEIQNTEESCQDKIFELIYC